MKCKKDKIKCILGLFTAEDITLDMIDKHPRRDELIVETLLMLPEIKSKWERERIKTGLKKFPKKMSK